MDTHGPRTTVALFAYGGIEPCTNQALIRDATAAAADSALVAYRSALIKAGHTVADVPCPTRAWPVTLHWPLQDAFVERSRATVARDFLAKSRDEVLIMVDHDIDWAPGDLVNIAKWCAQTRGIVGGVVNKRIRGQGVAVVWKPDGINANPEGVYDIGVDDKIVEVHYVGGAFTAYHRDVLEAVTNTVETVMPGYAPIFRCDPVPHPEEPGQKIALSEDWAICHLAKQLGYETWVSLMPRLGHMGKYLYTVVRDANPAAVSETAKEPAKKPPSFPAVETANVARPAISLIHATRGDWLKAIAVRERWLGMRAPDHRPVEYIFSVDDDDEEWRGKTVDGASIVVGQNRSCVGAYNRGARASRGEILVQVQDDVIPPKGWDDDIIERLDPAKSQALWLSDGLPKTVNEHNPDLVFMACGTRKFFRKLGGLFFPEYRNVYCDNDLGGAAREWRDLVDARDLVFRHDWQGNKYAPADWEQGQKLYIKRRAAKFPVAECESW